MCNEINWLWPKLADIFSDSIQWPTLGQWHGMIGTWTDMPNAFVANDGTSHRVLRPLGEPQHVSGHRSHHCMYTVIIIDCERRLRFVMSSFIRGHLNDAQISQLMPRMGTQEICTCVSC